MSKFASLRITPEWLEAPGVVAPELAATWSLLHISLDGDLVTQIADERARSMRDRIEVPTYPLARWVVRNWFFLLHHSRPLQIPAARRRFEGRSSSAWERSDWMLHHNLRAVGDGFVWPDLLLLSSPEEAHAEWWSDSVRRVGAQVRYLSSGAARLTRDGYEGALRRLVETTITRLEDQQVDGFPLADEWQAVLDLDDEEVDFCVAAARLGLDAFELSDDVADLVIRAGTELEAALLDDFLEAAQPQHLAADMTWLSEVSEVVESETSKAEGLPVLDGIDPGLPPPKRGLAEASLLRQELGLAPGVRVDPLRWLVLADVDNSDESLVGLGGLSASKTAVLATNGRQWRATSRRFVAARALREFVTLENPRFLVTSSRLPSQQANRAFAAQFLAPVAGIAEMVPQGPEPVPWESVEEVAEEFQVSPIVVLHQIEDGLDRPVRREPV